MTKLEQATVRAILVRQSTLLRVTIGQLQRGTMSIDKAVMDLSARADALDDTADLIPNEE